MGGAQSSNVTDVATNIGNTIQNSTSINQELINNRYDSISFYGCDMHSTNGKFATKIWATANIRQSQVNHVNGKANLANSVAQSAIQSATSKVGSLGIGYANASNAVSMLCNVTNDVVQQVCAQESLVSNSQNNITCNDTTIDVRGDITFSIDDSTNITQDMVTNNKQVADISNTVSQKVKQTASATVEGIAGALIAVAILIVAIGWSFGEVATSALGFMKPLITIGVAILIGFIIFLAWYNSWGPFFDKLVSCSNATTIGNGSTITGSGPSEKPQICETCLITDKKPQVSQLNSAPLKYTYPIVNKHDIDNANISDWKLTVAINTAISPACLFDIAAMSGATPVITDSPGSFNNSGFTIESLKQTNRVLSDFNTQLSAFKAIGIKNPIISAIVNLLDNHKIPPLLTDPSGNIPDLATEATSTGAKYYTVPVQYQVKGLSDNPVPLLQGRCTPASFTWNSNKKIPDWSQWGTAEDTNNAKCIPEGSYTLTGLTGGTTTESAYGIANNNKTSFIVWMSKLSKALSTDTSITSAAPNDPQSLAENVVSGFARTTLIYILNVWLANSGSSAFIEGSAWIFPWEILIITPPITSGIRTTFLTEVDATKFPTSVGSTFDFTQYKIQYKPSEHIAYNLIGSINPNTPGSISMVQGVCKNKHYELQHFMHTVGNWIILFIILVALVVIWRA
tara:strand:- start:1550 stop:3601 length:2052 start_codon:yes stop_codon:yes gene_type:complete